MLSYKEQRTMSKADQRKQALRQNIMNAVKANGIEVTGDTWFALVFRTESELKALARELHIVVA